MQEKENKEHRHHQLYVPMFTDMCVYVWSVLSPSLSYNHTTQPLHMLFPGAWNMFLFIFA